MDQLNYKLSESKYSLATGKIPLEKQSITNLYKSLQLENDIFNNIKDTEVCPRY